MPWVEVFAAFLVCHLAGDYLLQTELQATRKHGGFGRNAVARRALLSHTLSYTLAFAPALVWLASDDLGALELAAVAAAIAVPHAILDDGRLLESWMRRVKRTEPVAGTLAMMVDQSFHVLALFALALAAGT